MFACAVKLCIRTALPQPVLRRVEGFRLLLLWFSCWCFKVYFKMKSFTLVIYFSISVAIKGVYRVFEARNLYLYSWYLGWNEHLLCYSAAHRRSITSVVSGCCFWQQLRAGHCWASLGSTRGPLSSGWESWKLREAPALGLGKCKSLEREPLWAWKNHKLRFLTYSLGSGVELLHCWQHSGFGHHCQVLWGRGEWASQKRLAATLHLQSCLLLLTSGFYSNGGC